jgi:hypothetical protein
VIVAPGAIVTVAPGAMTTLPVNCWPSLHVVLAVIVVVGPPAPLLLLPVAPLLEPEPLAPPLLPVAPLLDPELLPPPPLLLLLLAPPLLAPLLPPTVPPPLPDAPPALCQPDPGTPGSDEQPAANARTTAATETFSD